MAETSAGGCVRSALRSAASTRPLACASGTSSAGRRSACASTCRSASSTEINATNYSRIPDASGFGAIMPGPAAALLDEPDALDAHAAVDGFDHVIDSEAG